MATNAFTTLKKKSQDPLTKKPRLTRTEDLNTVIGELKKLYKVQVKLNDQGDDSEVTIEVPSFTNSDPLYALGGGGGDTAVYPWDLTVVDAGGGLSDVTLRPGTVGGLTPTNIFTPQSISQTGTYYIWIDVTVTGNAISSCEVDSGSSAPSAPTITVNAPPTSFSVLVGALVDNEPINMALANISPTSQFRYRVHRSIPVPAGSSAWDYYYTWVW